MFAFHFFFLLTPGEYKVSGQDMKPLVGVVTLFEQVSGAIL